MDPTIEKIFALQFAVQYAIAVQLGRLLQAGQGNDPISQANPSTLSALTGSVIFNVQEIVRSAYTDAINILGDAKDWPAPPSGGGGAGAGTGQAATPGASIVALAKAIEQAVGADPSLTTKLNALLPPAASILTGAVAGAAQAAATSSVPPAAAAAGS